MKFYFILLYFFFSRKEKAKTKRKVACYKKSCLPAGRQELEIEN